MPDSPERCDTYQNTWPMTMGDLFPGGVAPQAIIHAPRRGEPDDGGAAYVLQLVEQSGAEMAAQHVRARFARLAEWKDEAGRRALLEGLDVERLPPAVIRSALVATVELAALEERRAFRERAIAALVRRLGAEEAARELDGVG